MAELKYTYALDETKTRLVHINDAQKGSVYYCLNSACNELMSVRGGSKRKTHFYHIKNGDKCSYDNYLHTLAQKKFTEWFESGRYFNIELKKRAVCSNYENCIWKSDNDELNDDCIKHYFSSYTLNQIYNKIEREKKHDNYIWDLLLTDCDNHNKSPLALEIYVTHKCDEDKINSGLRIIEVKIESEKQLDDIIISGKLIDGRDFISYNFKDDFKNADNIKIRLNKVALNNQMKSTWKLVDCKCYKTRRTDSIFEITFDHYLIAESTSYFDAFHWACAIIYKKFPSFRHCSLCTYYKYNDSYNEYICILYKKLQLKDKHDCTNAINCSHIQIDEQKIKDAINKIKYLSYNVWQKNDYKGERNFKRKFETLQ